MTLGDRKGGDGEAYRATHEEGEPGPADLDQLTGEERAEGCEADEGEEIQRDEPSPQVVRCGELDEGIRVRGEERERGADADQEDTGEPCLVDGRECDEERAEAGRPEDERLEGRPLEGRGGDGASSGETGASAGGLRRGFAQECGLTQFLGM